MSHEIRTPINSILGLNELILRDVNASDEVIKEANGIAGSGKMLLALINDILDFSKIEAGSMDIVPVDYKVGSLLSEVVNMVWIKAEEKGLKLEVSIDPGVPSVLYGDEVRIKQILINLLNNAVKYTKEGSISLHMESEDVGEESVLLRIAVSDTGMGIKSDALPYLFDAFKRVDEEKNRYIEGTGLGLSIVKQLIDLMDGDISVNSVYGEGSTFNVVVKQGVTNAERIGNLNIHNYGSAKRSAYESSFRAPEARILIVDDNEMNLEVEKKLLVDTGMTIDTVIDGNAALELTLSYQYDVILMDHLMPEMDGIECMEEIRTQTGGLNNFTPVIVLTANAGSENKALYRRVGFDGYLIKPISGESLEEMLALHIKSEKLIRKNKIQQMHDEMNTLNGYSRRIPIMISTSSMCDLPDAMMNDHHVPMIPFKVKTADGVFKDYYQMDTDEMVRYMRTGKDVASESPDISDYIDFFGNNLKKAHHLIYIAITTAMSEDYKRATEAAKSFDNVTVINSECLSSATGILVLIAYKLTQQEHTVEELVDEIEIVKKRLKCSFIVDTTKYLARRGLISERTSKMAGALSLRPCIRFINDKTDIGGVWMGSKRHAYRRYIQKVFPVDVIPDSEIVFITYVDLSEEMLMWIRDELSKMAYFEHIIFQKASAAISSNCGSGSFGILYFVKSNKNYSISTLLPPELLEENEHVGQEEENAQDIAAESLSELPAPQEERKNEKEKAWYETIEGIDGEFAIKNSGSEEALSTVLKMFYESIDEKAAELNVFFDSEDWENYTIKIHALKSSSKLIGARELSDKAYALEMAGKEGRIEEIKAGHPVFMEDYAGYKTRLAEVCGSAASEDKEQDKKKVVADEYLMEIVYEMIGEAAQSMDIDGIEEALKELSDYAIPEEEKEKFDAIVSAVHNYDYDEVLNILGMQE